MTPHPARAKAIADAEAKASQHLANGNAHREAGRTTQAEREFARAGRWLDKANELRGIGSGITRTDGR